MLFAEVWGLSLCKPFLRTNLSQRIDGIDAAQPCHGGGRGFESRLSRHHFKDLAAVYGLAFRPAKRQIEPRIAACRAEIEVAATSPSNF
jgi:hypothetical protein